jgi:hypothetical protein
MDHVETATRMNLNLGDLDSLIAGHATNNLASRIGVTMEDIETFIGGSATSTMASRLGLTMSAAEELARVAGREGAIGILLGLLLK